MKGFLPKAFPEHEILAFDATGSPYVRLAAQLPSLDAAKFRDALAAGLTTAEEASKSYATWGDMHRLIVHHDSNTQRPHIQRIEIEGDSLAERCEPSKLPQSVGIRRMQGACRLSAVISAG